VAEPPLPDDPVPDARDERIGALEAELEAIRAHVAELQLQLEVLSATDPLTGLANRAGMADHVEQALHRLARTGEPFAVMSIGIDALEAVLATHGELAHSAAVAHVAALLAAGLRAVDRVGRTEVAAFLVGLAELTADRAFVVERRVRTLLGAVPLEVGGAEVALEARIGLVAVAGQLALGAGDVVALAEEARRAATPDRAAVVSL
jgi:diguanylate cyclase (GGDEF)-like protein